MCVSNLYTLRLYGPVALHLWIKYYTWFLLAHVMFLKMHINLTCQIITRSSHNFTRGNNSPAVVECANLWPDQINITTIKQTDTQKISVISSETLSHDDVIKWKHFPRYWPFVRGIHRSPVNSPHKGQWLGALIFSLIGVWINGWVNNREAGDSRRYRTNYESV